MNSAQIVNGTLNVNETVRLAEAQRPGVTLTGRTLTVRFVPSRVPLGRPSSHAIAAALGKYLSISEGG